MKIKIKKLKMAKNQKIELPQRIRLSIVIPAYNEESRLKKEKTIEEYAEFFYKIYKNDFEIIVVLNGCKDNTFGVVQNAANKFKCIKIIDIKEGIGKGGAVVEGFRMASGDLIGFVDADKATKPDAFYDLVLKINGYDCIIASRRMEDSIVIPPRTSDRDRGSKGFNFFTRTLFGLKFKDTQCGAKLMNKNACKSVLSDIIIKRWAFDVDLLYSLKRKGFRIIEVPTVWSERDDSKLTWNTPYEMFMSLIKLRIRKLF